MDFTETVWKNGRRRGYDRGERQTGSGAAAVTRQGMDRSPVFISPAPRLSSFIGRTAKADAGRLPASAFVSLSAQSSPWEAGASSRITSTFSVMLSMMPAEMYCLACRMAFWMA